MEDTLKKPTYVIRDVKQLYWLQTEKSFLGPNSPV